MNQIKSLKRSLGDRYRFEKFMSEKEIRGLVNASPSDFSDMVAAVLTAGCVKIELVIFKAYDSLVLGYDVFVKDDPDSHDWICYDNLTDPVCTKDRRTEQEMAAVLNRIVESCGLSYTDCSFETVEGKQSRKAD